MSDRSDLDTRHSLLPPEARVPPSAPGSDTERLVAGALTWVLLVLMPWLAVAVMLSLLILPMLPLAVLTAYFYLALTVRRAGRPTVARVGGAVVLMAGLVWTEWAALMTADHLARNIVAASRGQDAHFGVAEPMASSLIGVLLFFVGMKLIGRERGGAAVVWETIALALICPVVALLVRLNVLPLTG